MDLQTCLDKSLLTIQARNLRKRKLRNSTRLQAEQPTLQIFNKSFQLLPYERLTTDNLSFDTFSLGKKRKRNYLTVDFNFDIETTSTRLDGKKVAWVYHWQCGFNNKVYFGRYLEDFLEVLEKVNALAEQHDARVICLVHNLSYEFTYLTNIVKFDHLFAKSANKPIYACWKNIEFRCSYMFSNMSLDLLSQTYCETKKANGDLDYSVVRYPWTPMTQRERYYCYCDCKILSEFWYNHILPEYIYIQHPWLPLTNTAKVRQDMRRRISDWKAYKRLYSSIYPSEPIYDILLDCFYGGIVRANALYTGKTLKWIASRDRTSSYPHVQLAYQYPMGRFHRVTNGDDYPASDYCKMYRVVLKDCLAVKGLSIIPEHKAIKISKDRVLDNGRLYSGTIELYCTDVDLSIWSRYYTFKAIVKEVYVSKKGRLCHFQINSLFDAYIQKNKLRGVAGMAELYGKAKNMLNSNFGCCCTSKNDRNYSYDSINDEWTDEPAIYEEKVNEFLLFQVGVWITALARYELLDMALKLIDYAEDNGLKHPIVYMDTDSIKYHYENGAYEHLFDQQDKRIVEGVKSGCDYYNLDFKDVSTLGTWDLETAKTKKWNLPNGLSISQKKKTYGTFKTLGSKRYVHDGECTVSGLPKQAWKEYKALKEKDGLSAYDIFQHGLNIPSPMSHKQCFSYQYNQEQYTISHADRPLITPKNFVHSEDIDFNLSLSSDYIKFISWIAETDSMRRSKDAL